MRRTFGDTVSMLLEQGSEGIEGRGHRQQAACGMCPQEGICIEPVKVDSIQ